MPAEGEKNRVTFLKRKTNALFSRLQRLQTSLSIETLSGYDEFTLTVRLEQIDELQSAFNVLHTELEELDFDEIGSEMSESFFEFIVEFKARVRAEIAKRNVHFAPHSTLAEGIVPHQCSGPQTQPRPRPMPLPPVQLPTFGGGYANWADFHSVFTSIIDSHPDLSNVEKFQHLRLVQLSHLWEDLQSLKTLGRVSSSSPISSLSPFLDQFGLLRVGGRLRNSSLDFDGRHPNNCHISAVINSRPLVPISENPADLDVLTPAHFLNGGPPSSFDEPDITGLNYNRLDSWQRISFLQHIFWSRWKEEYLTLLQQRSKWRTPKPGAAVDNVVLVKDENLPPMRWPLARAMQLIPGRDGVARVAELRTASGVIRRAVNKLCLLPLKDSVGTQASNGGRMLGHAAAKTVQ